MKLKRLIIIMINKMKFIYYDMDSHEQQCHIRDIVYPLAFMDLNEIANSICNSLKLSGIYSYVCYEILNNVRYSESKLIREATIQMSYRLWNISKN